MLTQSAVQKIDIVSLKQSCARCSLRELCLPLGLNADEMDELDELVSTRKSLKRREYAFRMDTPFRSLYAIRSGFFKTYDLQEDGSEQITGFQMAGELIGMDAISTDHHTCNAVALEDSELCEIPFAQLEDLIRHIPALQHQFHKLMSREIIRDHGIMMLLGSMNAEQRLATFLLNLSQRFAMRGYSPTRFTLRMTRAEIGNYLGMKLETVSRTLSKFQEAGLLLVQNKELELTQMEQLKHITKRDEC